MPPIKSAAEIAAKWARVTPGRRQDFETGVRTPARDWATETAAANDRFVQGVTEAAQQGRFARGVREAGTEKWQRKTLAVGVARWGAGVQQAEEEMQAGFEPFRNAIERVELPPRFPAGSPQNIDRVRAIAERLHELKVRGR
jgi:hypothetical protein